MPLFLDYLPRLPQRKDFRIGCAGAGFIMRNYHLVAYRHAGFNPVAIASRSPDRARAAAEQQNIPRVHASYAELLADPQVEVLDIAVPPDAQPALIRAAVNHKDHLRGILAQKPLAMTYAEARECVDLCAWAGIVLAVNQNMRYDQSVRALKDLLRRGVLGEPVLATIDMGAIPHWMPWSAGLRSLSTFVMSIHHLDTFRYWLGTPDRVLASTRPDPRTRFPHTDGINLYILEYDNGCRASGWDDVWAGPAREGAAADIGIRWRVEGTKGLAHGTIGWPTYPARTPSTIDYTTTAEAVWQQPRWPEVWFPDAFAGTMAQLLCALEDGVEPEISGRDNLETIALCEAVYTAARDHRVTAVREFMERHLDTNELRQLLEQVRSGERDVEDAVSRLGTPTVADLGYANVDLQRRQRCGFPEVIFCQGKAPEWVAGVVQKLAEAGQDCLATRVSDEQAAHLARVYPQAEQDRVARTFWLPAVGQAAGLPSEGRPAACPTAGRVVVLTAGTSDLPVAQEAVVTARALGCEVELKADVGVAGIHRLLRHRELYASADAIVVVAGMDGTLPSVVGGLVDCPVIAVPTSVGYGASFGGLAALLTMLNCCSAGVVVVNIDSGFKGGYVAALIARRAAGKTGG